MWFQKRGAPHFHILVDVSLESEKEDVSAAWHGQIETEDKKHLATETRVEKLRTSDGGARYAVSYAKKPYQKDVPMAYQNVGRFWGHSRGVKPESRYTIPVE